MAFGQNEGAVSEVLMLAEAQRVLVGRSRAVDVCAEYDFATACRMAWEDVYGSDGYSWTDIREREMSEVHRGRYDAAEMHDVRAALQHTHQRQLSCLRRNLAGMHDAILDDVFADLSNCALKRAVCGRSPGFFEDVFQIYESGGWPCGWSGVYPAHGGLIAYFAHARP